MGVYRFDWVLEADISWILLPQFYCCIPCFPLNPHMQYSVFTVNGMISIYPCILHSLSDIMAFVPKFKQPYLIFIFLSALWKKIFITLTARWFLVNSMRKLPIDSPVSIHASYCSAQWEGSHPNSIATQACTCQKYFK